MTNSRQYLLTQVLFLSIFVVIVDSTCRKRCRLDLEKIGYRTCVERETGCKKSPSGTSERCNKKLPGTKLSEDVINAASISASVTSLDGSGTPLAAFTGGMDTFWVIIDPDPYIQIVFQEELVIDYMIITGSPHLSESVTINLEYLEVFVNDMMIPETAYVRNFKINTVTVTGSERDVKKMKFRRHRPETYGSVNWRVSN